jgi:DNA polymerase alpha subunit A
MKARTAPQPKTKVVNTTADDNFMASLLEEVDTNVPAPRSRKTKRNRSPDQRRARALSPAPEDRHRATKKTKVQDDRLPPTPDAQDQDGFIHAMDDDLPPSAADVPMSDPEPAPSSPIAKAVERKVQIKSEIVSDDEEDLMEVAHASKINAASVNISASRPVKKLVKPDPYPSPANSSPLKPAETAVDVGAWNELTSKLNVVSSSPGETRTVGKLDYKHAIEEDGSLNFFWTDYTEVNGSLCLFGKVLNKKNGSYVSCFVKVDNILRKLYFLPRQYRQKDGEDTGEEVEMMDVYGEVDELMSKMKVDMHKMKATTRKYAFELPGIPKEGQYMKVLYPYTSESQQDPRLVCLVLSNVVCRTPTLSRRRRRDLLPCIWVQHSSL